MISGRARDGCEARFDHDTSAWGPWPKLCPAHRAPSEPWPLEPNERCAIRPLDEQDLTETDATENEESAMRRKAKHSDKTCKSCGKTFTPTGGRQSYCYDPCTKATAFAAKRAGKAKGRAPRAGKAADERAPRRVRVPKASTQHPAGDADPFARARARKETRKRLRELLAAELADFDPADRLSLLVDVVLELEEAADSA